MSGFLAPAGMRNKLVGQESTKANKHLSPAGSRKKLQGQEPSLGNNHLTSCRNENEACSTGKLQFELHSPALRPHIATEKSGT